MNPGPAQLVARRRCGGLLVNRAGFSLIELLFVLVIIAVLSYLVFSSPGVMRSSSLTTAATMVMEDMAYARELSISSNAATEVWFFQPTGGNLITGLRIYTVDPNGNSTAYGPVHPLPASVGIDPGTSISTLFATANQEVWNSSSPQPTVPGYGTSYTAWFVRFMPDGSTTLTAPATQWYLTLHDVSLGANVSPLPKNYAIVSTDYLTGAVTLYRP